MVPTNAIFEIIVNRRRKNPPPCSPLANGPIGFTTKGSSLVPNLKCVDDNGEDDAEEDGALRLIRLGFSMFCCSCDKIEGFVSRFVASTKGDSLFKFPVCDRAER